MTRWIGLLTWGLFISYCQIFAQVVQPLDSSNIQLLRLKDPTIAIEKLVAGGNAGSNDESIQSIDAINATSTRWFPVGSGFTDAVWAIATQGSNVYAGGLFNGKIAKWNGSSWQSLGSGISGTTPTVSVYAIAIDSPSVYAGGTFGDAGGVATNAIARWDGTTWHALGSGLGQNGYAGVPSVQSIAVSGGQVYVGGAFATAGEIPVSNIAKWNGAAWEPLGNGFNGSVRALAMMNGNLYAGGSFDSSGTTPTRHLAMWNGSSWQQVGGGIDGDVYALAVSGSTLYAGGIFTLAGTTPVHSIAKWNGVTWDSLGSGITIGTGIGIVNCLTANGTDIFAGGFFYGAGGKSVSNVAKWDGVKWVVLGGGVDNMALAVSASGIDAYYGGSFATADGVAASRIARYWNVGSTDINLIAGWNLVSVPRFQSNYDASVVFPGKFGDMYAYNASTQSYQAEIILAGGYGYWIYYTSSRTVTIIGLTLGSVTIPCQLGWNLIGSQDVELQLSSITVSGGAIIFGSAFRYNATTKNYEATYNILPGEGVWIYVTKTCNIILPG